MIERLDLELSPGFNVITGETGAGKSILIDALTLVLGGRARPELVRSGAEDAEVEALFQLASPSPSPSPSASRLLAKLASAGLPVGSELESELVVRRVVQALSRAVERGDGSARSDSRETRSRAYLNGRLCTAAQLSELAADLCDIASQHESVSLTDPATHVEYLDAFGKLESERKRLGEQVEAIVVLARELETTSALERGRAEREDFLRWQIRDIDELDVREGEETALEHERGRLRHADRLEAATRRAADRLYDGETAICDELARLVAEIDQAAAIDGSLVAYARVVESSRSELADAARALARYADGVEARPERLAEVEERMFRLQKVLRKHGPTTADLLAHRASLSIELESLSTAAGRVSELEDQKRERLAEAAAAARALSRKRRDVAEDLADAIGAELADLGMGRARVVVDVTPAIAANDALLIDGARLTRTGIDRVEFLIAPNPGEEPRPLRKIASGGELSRALLALKRVLADQGPVGTYVFDEVDAGVGGAIAEVIGRSIADIARHRQVICITHLPQIAALADVHFVVDKTESNGRTLTRVRRLAKAERVDEIARMLGGIKVGNAQRRAAAEMLKS